MIKKIFISLVLFSVISPAHAYKVKTFKPLMPMDIQTLQPQVQDALGSANNAQVVSSSSSYPKITQLELGIFRKSYEREDIYSRLTRLENKVFRRSFTGMPLASRVDNLLTNVDMGLMHGITNRDLSKLEMKVIGRTYPNDDTESRITRMEKEMLGAMQGGTLKERFETVKTASKHYNSYPEIVQSQTVYPHYAMGGFGYSPQMQSSYSGNYRGFGQPTFGGVNGLVQGLIGRLFGGFSGAGMLTGSTPPIYDPYNPYSMQGGSGGFGQQDYCIGNTGGYIRNRDLRSGSTVRILD